MSDLETEKQKLYDRVEIEHDDNCPKDWDVNITIPKYGIIGEEWEIKTSKPVKKIHLICSNSIKFGNPDPIWKPQGKHKLYVGGTIFNKTVENTDTLKGEWKSGRRFNGEFRNLLQAGEYFFEVTASDKGAGEVVLVRTILQVVKEKGDLKDLKKPVEKYDIPKDSKKPIIEEYDNSNDYDVEDEKKWDGNDY